MDARLRLGLGLSTGVLAVSWAAILVRLAEAPALSVAAQMGLQGARVVVTDPQAIANAEARWPDLTYAPTAEQAAAGADVVVLATEWDEYRDLDPTTFGEIVARRRIVDGRNVLDPGKWRAAGWTYRALGRP